MITNRSAFIINICGFFMITGLAIGHLIYGNVLGAFVAMLINMINLVSAIWNYGEAVRNGQL